MKPYTTLSLVLMALLCLIPPIDLVLKNPAQEHWFWMVLITSFFGIYLCFMKVNIFIKAIAVGGFLNCFFSVAPYLSFSSYVLLVIFCYFYVCATRIEDWNVIFKGVTCLLLINCILIAMQLTGHDTLLNWDVGPIGRANIDNIRIGVIGQHMQMGSFSIILSTFLLILSPWFLIFPLVVAFICHSVWSVASIGAAMGILLLYKNKRLAGAFMAIFVVFFMILSLATSKVNQAFASSGRIPVFKQTLQFANQKPWTGWGIGTYKNVFPAISDKSHLPYKTAHCDFLQILFEVGYPGFALMIISILLLIFFLFVLRKKIYLAGLAMLLVNMLGHFPCREIQCVPLIILFLALCEVQWRRYA